MRVHPGHDPSALRGPAPSFFDSEPAQVWALHRDSGEPFYLPRGQAAEHRAFARTRLRCLYPGCTSEISTRGGSRRDHFFHLSAARHETGRESEFHLAAKAMLTRWAASRVPAGAQVAEEQTVKDPATRLLRRADVMVTGQHGGRVAYEVEYKSFAIEDWRRKHGDYERHQVRCLWLLGHTRLREAPYARAAGVPGPVGYPVIVPGLASAMARAAAPLVYVNPITRQIGTLAGAADLSRRYAGISPMAWVVVDDLDDCVWDRSWGLVTPAMRVIAAREAAAREAEQAAREAAAGSGAQVPPEKNAAAGPRLTEPRPTVVSEGAMRDWLHSPVRARLIRRFPGGVPAVLSADSATGSRDLMGTPLPWRAAIYLALTRYSRAMLSPQGPNSEVQVLERAVEVLREEGMLSLGIGAPGSKRAAEIAQAVMAFLIDLQDHGVTEVSTDPRTGQKVVRMTGVRLPGDGLR